MEKVKFISHKIVHYINSMEDDYMPYRFFDKFYDKTEKFDAISECLFDSDTMHFLVDKT